MTPKELGATIKNQRKALRLTHAQLADMAACSKPFVIAAESGKPSLRLDKLLALLEVLGLALTIQPAERHG
jgi:y4mF family transcriptional regulator